MGKWGINWFQVGSAWGGGIALDRLAPTPLQPREKQWLIDVGMLLVTMALMLSMLLQSGAIIDLWRQSTTIETRLAEQEEGGCYSNMHASVHIRLRLNMLPEKGFIARVNMT